MMIRQPNNSPAKSESGFPPENLRRAVRLGLESIVIPRVDVHILVPVFINIDSRRANAAYPCASHSTSPHRIEQNNELPSMILSRKNDVDGNLVLKLPVIHRGQDDRRVDTQDRESIQVPSALVANLDNVALAKQRIGFASLVVLGFSITASRIDHCIPSRCRNLQRPTRLCFLEFVTAHVASSPCQSKEREIAVRVNLFDISRDWLLDQRVGTLILIIGESHPQVVPTFLGDSGNRSKT
jgi:hypothetical protein